MVNESLENIKKANDILNKTIDTIENSRDELFDVVEFTRKEYKNIEKELELIKSKVEKVIKDVDTLEVKERKSRHRLAKVSKNFNLHNEKDIKVAYEEANNLRVKLMLKREEERILVAKRRDLEIRLKESYRVFKKAENITKQVNVASEYLKGNLDDIMLTIDDLSKKQYLGIKILEAQEEERRRLSREIHDGPAQSLASIIIKVELCKSLMDKDLGKSREELENLKIVVRELLRDTREIIYDLRPMSLDDLGLEPTLKRYIYKFKKDTKIDVELSIIGKLNNLKSAVEIAIFRVIQEGLSNIKKHSKATSANIRIENMSNKINIFISDNGIGFNSDEDRSITMEKFMEGYGLISMRERVGLLGGKMQLRSLPGSGTRIYLYIPIGEGG